VLFEVLHGIFNERFLKIKNVDKIKNVKNVTGIKNVKKRFLHLCCRDYNRVGVHLRVRAGEVCSVLNFHVGWYKPMRDLQQTDKHTSSSHKPRFPLHGAGLTR